MDIKTNINWYEYHDLYNEYKRYFGLDIKVKIVRSLDPEFDNIYTAIMALDISEDDYKEEIEMNNHIWELASPKVKFRGEPEYDNPDLDLGEAGEKLIIDYLIDQYPDEEEPEHVAVTRKNEYPGYDIEHIRYNNEQERIKAPYLSNMDKW